MTAAAPGNGECDFDGGSAALRARFDDAGGLTRVVGPYDCY